ncbi:Hypothetical_protein [Hexamita inflata]|uniref:Hypothetical_protein n=1 Tax=Hexamita inflata TaxID=28002 RepID=A0AA86TXF8_9EUKA|nr:Hypothetical protein HINF_LOCUS19651 [Hexamita inflata]
MVNIQSYIWSEKAFRKRYYYNKLYNYNIVQYISHFLETAQTDFIETFEQTFENKGSRTPVFPLSKRAQPVIYAHSVKTQQGPHGVVSGPVLPDSLTQFQKTLLLQQIIQLQYCLIYTIVQLLQQITIQTVTKQYFSLASNSVIRNIADFNEQFILFQQHFQQHLKLKKYLLNTSQSQKIYQKLRCKNVGVRMRYPLIIIDWSNCQQQKTWR